MKSASVHELKKELSALDTSKLLELCMTLARYKQDNKEFLTYLLFHTQDEQDFIVSVKEEIDELFADVNTSSNYLAKKTLRKIIRVLTKYIRYTGSKTVEIEVLMHYCLRFKALGLNMESSTVLANLYTQQIKKIQKALSGLHEDLQYDYKIELDPLL